MVERRKGRVGAHSLAAALAVLLAGGGAGAADDLRREVEALRPRDAAGRERAVLDDLERRAVAALEAIPRAHSAREADAARPGLCRKLETSLGAGRLLWPPALHPRVVGTIARPGYRIDKVVYETLPGAPVPAHLYLPEPREGRVP